MVDDIQELYSYLFYTSLIFFSGSLFKGRLFVKMWNDFEKINLIVFSISKYLKDMKFSSG